LFCQGYFNLNSYKQDCLLQQCLILFGLIR